MGISDCPAIWQIGSRDSLIQPDWAAAAVDRMRRSYQAMNADDMLVIDRFDGGHEWNWQHVLPRLQQVLQHTDASQQ